VGGTPNPLRKFYPASLWGEFGKKISEKVRWFPICVGLFPKLIPSSPVQRIINPLPVKPQEGKPKRDPWVPWENPPKMK